jgi:hypothetical protein
MAVSYFLRVLAAMAQEMKLVPHRPLKVYLSKFQPSRPDAIRFDQSKRRAERGELIVTTSDAQQSKLPFKIGERIALAVVAAVVLIYPTILVKF